MSLKRFLSNYPIMAVVVAVWAMCLVTGTMIGVFMLAEEVNAPLASIVVSVVGIPAVAFGLYEARMAINQQRNDPPQ